MIRMLYSLTMVLAWFPSRPAPGLGCLLPSSLSTKQLGARGEMIVVLALAMNQASDHSTACLLLDAVGQDVQLCH